jgi:FkbM family methyltransferase
MDLSPVTTITETAIFKTKWGTDITAHYRAGKNDWNTLQSIIVEDEYNLNSIPLPVTGVLYAIDLGSHIGGFSLAACALGLNVLSVECLPENCDMQSRSFAANQLGDEDVILLNRAIHSKSGKTIEVSYGDTSTDSGAHHEFVGGSVTHAGGRSVQVETIDLAECISILCKGAGQVIVKTDCEGAEWEAFKNLPNAVIARIDWIVGEIHPLGENKSKQDLLKMLRGKYEDVSASYKTYNGSNDLCTFVFKRKVVG